MYIIIIIIIIIKRQSEGLFNLHVTEALFCCYFSFLLVGVIL